MGCCPPGGRDPNGCNQVFRRRWAARTRRAFERRGLDERQEALLSYPPLAGRTVLDLGCGVGSLGLTALARGARTATFVDASEASLATARELALARGVAGRADFELGDAARSTLPDADLVLLDRVVCCTPDGPELLRRAGERARAALAFTHPPATWWTRACLVLGNAAMRLLRRDYRAYLHPLGALQAALREAGLEPQARERHGLWRLERWVRPPPPGGPGPGRATRT